MHVLSNDVMVGFHVYRVSSTEYFSLPSFTTRTEICCEIIYNKEQFLITYDQLDAHTFHCCGFAVAMKSSSQHYDVFTGDGSISSFPTSVFEGMSSQLSNDEAKKAVHFGHLNFLPPLATVRIPPPLQRVLLHFARWEPQQHIPKCSRASTWLASHFASLQLASVGRGYNCDG